MKWGIEMKVDGQTKKYQGMMRGIVKYGMIGLILLGGIGIIWQYRMQQLDQVKYGPVGRFVDVGSYKAHVYEEGEGPEAVVFIAGSGTPSAYTDFYYLQQKLSDKAYTLSYDHVGFGWSEEAEEPRDIDTLVEELAIIIQPEKWRDKSIVLVCHSLGALEAIAFAQAYPEKVGGIVFLDCGSPEYYAEYVEPMPILINRAAAFLRATGISRMLLKYEMPIPFYGEDLRVSAFPEKIKAVDRAMYNKYAGASSSLGVIKLINENAEKVMERGDLGGMPVLLLTAERDKKWQDVQSQLANWSDNSQYMSIEGAEHYIHWSNKEQVVEGINLFLEKIKE